MYIVVETEIDVPEEKIHQVGGFPSEFENGHLYYVPCTGFCMWYAVDEELISVYPSMSHNPYFTKL